MDELIVDLHPVGRIQVFNNVVAVLKIDFRMVPGDFLVVQDQIVVIGTTDLKFFLTQLKTFRLACPVTTSTVGWMAGSSF